MLHSSCCNSCFARFHHLRQCKVHKSVDDESQEGFRRLRLNAAGVTCHAWSAEGASAGAAHESEIPLAVWLAERVRMFEQNAEDIAYLECAPRFPAQARLEEAFGTLAKVFAWRDGPEWHGWPHRRNRVLAVAINNATVEWLGPSTLDEVKSDYGKRFYRQNIITGEMLMIASDDDRLEEMMVLARGRKHNVNKEELAEIVESGNFEKLSSLILPPGGVHRLKEWQDVFEQKVASSPNKPRPFLCDVDHHPSSKGGQGGARCCS